LSKKNKQTIRTEKNGHRNSDHHDLCHIFNLATYFDNTGPSTGLKMARWC